VESMPDALHSSSKFKRSIHQDIAASGRLPQRKFQFCLPFSKLDCGE
jgi:hypothetical protein